VIELDLSLDIDTVTEIFYRLNSQGIKLAQPDFVMSKIAADSQYGGNILKKAIDTFCYLIKNPGCYDQICNDNEFKTTDYFEKLKWLKDERNLVYEPDYNFLIRVAFMQKFSRSTLKDLVSLLSGRDFKTHEYREEIAEESFSKLREGVMEVIQKDNFKQFTLALSNAGFVLNSLISPSAANFGYTLLFLLKRDQNIAKQTIIRYLQKWYVMSVLTGRYTGSPESRMGSDLREITEKGFLRVLNEVESTELPSAFWRKKLPLLLEGQASNSPYFKVYCAALIRKGVSALLQNGTPNRNLIEIHGNKHHIFPKEYLKRNSVDKFQINQIANITYLDPQVNKAVRDSAPCEYFSKVFEQCTTKTPVYGDIVDIEVLKRNLQENCVPESIQEMDYTRYSEFLGERRKLMAAAIKEYYEGL